MQVILRRCDLIGVWEACIQLLAISADLQREQTGMRWPQATLRLRQS